MNTVYDSKISLQSGDLVLLEKNKPSIIITLRRS